MAIGLKTFVTISAIVGSGTSFPLFFWKTNDSVVTSQKVFQGVRSKIQTISKRLPEDLVNKANKGNCSVEELSEDSADLLVSRGKEGKFYVEVFCQKTNKKTSNGSLPPDWTGLFPSKVFADNYELAIGKKFDINTETITTAENTKTTFIGGGIKSTITGTWEEKLRTKGGHSTVSISLSTTTEIEDEIYLIYY